MSTGSVAGSVVCQTMVGHTPTLSHSVAAEHIFPSSTPCLRISLRDESRMQLATRWTAFLPHTMQPDSLN